MRPCRHVQLSSYEIRVSRASYRDRGPVKIRDDETPRFADLVVYDDDEHKRPFIVVETKKPHRRDGERQAQRYATILRATYTLWNNGTDPMTASTLVNRYPEEAISISDVPVFGGQPRYDVQTLDPFPDDRAGRGGDPTVSRLDT